MFSYRHAFHAGNHADVLKHAVLAQILDYLGRKPTPYWVVDTHAGGGLYALEGDWSRRSAEAAQGLARIMDASPAAPTQAQIPTAKPKPEGPGRTQKQAQVATPTQAQGRTSAAETAATPPVLVARYLDVVRQFNPEGGLRFYPGSPCLALALMRPHDELRLFELHPTEYDVLRDTLAQCDAQAQRQTRILHQDGFSGLKGLLPPPSRRGLVLIDPSYEDKHDYKHVLRALRDGLARFAHGCFAVWYPLIQRPQAHELARAMERLPVAWLNARLTVRKPSADGRGLHGSGMFIINPPWTLHDELLTALPWLAAQLGVDEHARWTITHSGDGADPQKGSKRRKKDG